MPATVLPRIEPYEGPEDRDGFLVRTPFHEGFIAELKAHLPSGDRRWFAESGQWWVAAERDETLRFLLTRFFGDYAVVQEDGSVEIVTRSGERIRQGGLFA